MPANNKDYYKNTSYNVLKIYKTLRDSHRDGNEFMTVSSIAKRAGLHKWTVSRTLDIYMSGMVDIIQPEEMEAIGLTVKIVKLKDENLTPKQVLNYLKMRRKISL